MVIAVVHHESNKLFLKDLLKSLKGVKHTVKVYENDPMDSRYELGVLKQALDEFDDDIFLLQDSCEVKDKSIFDKASKHNGGMALCDRFMSYLGKYDKEVLKRIGIPEARSKDESIGHELYWNAKYISSDPNFLFLDPMVDNDRREYKHGRINMILENQWIKKYKGRWS